MMKFKYLFLAFFLTACNLGGSDIRPLNPPFMPAPPEGGPQEFQHGWRDGCETGMAQHGTDIYRSSYKFKQDPNQVLNPIYYKAWKDAENYCRSYIYEYTLRSTAMYCSVDGLVNDCAGSDNSPGFFMGGSGDAIGRGVFGGGGGGVSSVMGNAGGAPGLGDVDEGSFMGSW